MNVSVISWLLALEIVWLLCSHAGSQFNSFSRLRVFMCMCRLTFRGKLRIYHSHTSHHRRKFHSNTSPQSITAHKRKGSVRHSACNHHAHRAATLVRFSIAHHGPYNCAQHRAPYSFWCSPITIAHKSIDSVTTIRTSDNCTQRELSLVTATLQLLITRIYMKSNNSDGGLFFIFIFVLRAMCTCPEKWEIVSRQRVSTTWLFSVDICVQYGMVFWAENITENIYLAWHGNRWNGNGINQWENVSTRKKFTFQSGILKKTHTKTSHTISTALFEMISISCSVFCGFHISYEIIQRLWYVHIK